MKVSVEFQEPDCKNKSVIIREMLKKFVAILEKHPVYLSMITGIISGIVAGIISGIIVGLILNKFIK